MVKFITILLILISIPGFSQVKEINPDEFERINLSKSLAYLGHGNFGNFLSCRCPWIENEFHSIELDTITYKLHITGKIFYSMTPSSDMEVDLNVGEIISKDKSGLKMKFTHYFHTDNKGNYDISFVIDNANSLLSFNTKETFAEFIHIKISDVYEVGKLLK
jgi:hypothetical protein